MKILENYNSFITNIKLNEAFFVDEDDKKIILSPRMKDILHNIGDEVSQYLLDMETNSTIGYPMIDVNEDDKVTVTYANDNRPVTMKIGRLLVKLLGDKFDPRNIENFVHLYKQENIDDLDFEVVQGDDILKYYTRNNYESDSGMLGMSDMNNYPEKVKWFVEHPEKVSLLIAKHSGSDKIVGRALLWKIDEVDGEHVDNVFLLDRQYGTEEIYAASLRKAAKDAGYIVRNSGIESDIKDELAIKIDIDVNNLNPDKLPWFDTFKYYDKDRKALVNIETPNVIELN